VTQLLRVKSGDQEPPRCSRITVGRTPSVRPPNASACRVARRVTCASWRVHFASSCAGMRQAPIATASPTSHGSPRRTTGARRGIATRSISAAPAAITPTGSVRPSSEGSAPQATAHPRYRSTGNPATVASETPKLHHPSRVATTCTASNDGMFHPVASRAAARWRRFGANASQATAVRQSGAYSAEARIRSLASIVPNARSAAVG